MDLLNRLQLEMAIKQQREMLPEFKELCKLAAEQMSMYYEELTKAGFNNGQALAIVINHGVDAGKISKMGNGGDRDGD